MLAMIIKITIIFSGQQTTKGAGRSLALNEEKKRSMKAFLLLSLSTLYRRPGKRRKRRNEIVHEEARQGETSRHPGNARRSRRRRRGRQVALNWKSPKLEFSCQSWALCLQGLFRRRSRLLPATLLFIPPPSREPSSGTDKFVDVYTEITWERRLREHSGSCRSIGCRKSDDERADSTFRGARTRPPNPASLVAKTIKRGYRRATRNRIAVRFGEWKRADLSMPR